MCTRRRSLVGDLHIDLLAKLWLRERHLSRFISARTQVGGICIYYDNEISMLKKQKNKKKKTPKRPKDTKSFRTGGGGASCWVKRRWAGSGASVWMARRSARLRSAGRRQMGFPSRDTTTFPPSFSARVLRSWMSSSPFTCHSCLIPGHR